MLVEFNWLILFFWEKLNIADYYTITVNVHNTSSYLNFL